MNFRSLRGSLRFRLLATTLLWIFASIAFAGWGLGRLFHEHVSAQFRAELTRHLDQLTAHLVLDAQGRPSLSLPLSDPRFNLPFGGMYWQVDHVGGADGVLRSRSLWDQVLTVPTDTPSDGQIHRHRIAGPQETTLGVLERTVRIDEVPLRVLAAADVRLLSEPVERFNGVLWLALGALAVGLTIAALLQVFVGLSPLRQLRLALAQVRDGHARSLEGRFPTELTPLVDEFNSVLAQNSEVVERARTQAGNLAHALKTPLSVLANATDGRDDKLAQLVRSQLLVAQKQVDYHLARAQAAASVRLPGARTPVPPVIEGLLRTMQRIHAERGLHLAALPASGAAAFRGEEQDLQEMLGNLLDNACKWAVARVEVGVGTADGQLTIMVDDDGPGISVDQREVVIRRGVRADEQVPGTGLGLAIVDDLARLYGGRLELGDSPLGGLRAGLHLPLARSGGDAFMAG